MKLPSFSLIVVVSLITINARADTVTIINTSDHPVVIGIYETTSQGVKETLVPVNTLTEVQKVPISYNGNECFAIAYRAESRNSSVTRATPTVIHGMQKLTGADLRTGSKTEETVLQYRADTHFPERDTFNSNLYTAGGGSAHIKEQVDRSYGDKIVKSEYVPAE